MAKDIEITNLEDLEKLRSAPRLNKKQKEELFIQVKHLILKTDWLTIGVMSPTLTTAINAIRRIEEKFKFNEMKCTTFPTSNGPIFLKANQKTGKIHARIEFGLGEGILITCQYNDSSMISKTFGPFPLDFFD